MSNRDDREGSWRNNRGVLVVSAIFTLNSGFFTAIMLVHVASGAELERREWVFLGVLMLILGISAFVLVATVVAACRERL